MPRTDRNGTPYRCAVCASAADSMSMATAVGNAARIRSTRLASMNASPDSTVPVSTRRSTRGADGGVVQHLLGLVHLGHARHLAQLVPEGARVGAGVDVLGADDDVAHPDVEPDPARAAGADDRARVRALDGDGRGGGGVDQADPALHEQHLPAADGEQPVLGVAHLRRVADDVRARHERRGLVGHRGHDDRVDGDHAVTVLHSARAARNVRAASWAPSSVWLAPQPHCTSLAAGTSVAVRTSSSVDCDQVEHLVVRPDALQDQVEAGLAAHRGEVDDAVGVVAGVLREQVLERVHGRHLEVRDVRLREADVVLAQLVAGGQALGVGEPDVRRDDGAVVEVERLDVHAGLVHG